MLFDRQEDHADTVFAYRRQREPKFRAFAAEKLVRDLNENSGAVTCLRIAAARSAVRQVDQDLNAFGDDFMRRFALDIDEKANSAGVALVDRVI